MIRQRKTSGIDGTPQPRRPRLWPHAVQFRRLRGEVRVANFRPECNNSHLLNSSKSLQAGFSGSCMRGNSLAEYKLHSLKTLWIGMENYIWSQSYFLWNACYLYKVMCVLLHYCDHHKISNKNYNLSTLDEYSKINVAQPNHFHCREVENSEIKDAYVSLNIHGWSPGTKE